ncbi:MAG: RNA polymerase factor sigma-54 [Bacillota bacterium]
MRLGFNLSLEQTQKLVMTPELRQAIAILQMSTLELSQYIQQQLESNPMLDTKEDGLDDRDTNEDTEPAGEGDQDNDWQEYFQDRSDLGVVANPKERPEETSSYENYVATVPTLTDHLQFQLQMAPLTPREKEISEFLLGLLDERGYLPSDLTEVTDRFGITCCTLEEIIRVLQGFDPAGIAARDLRECLTIQLDQLGVDSEIVDTIIAQHLDELASGKLTKIAESIGCSVVQVQEAVDLIRTLDPKPGSKYGSPNDNRYIVPDLIVERVGREYVTIVNDSSAPRLTVSSAYRALLNDNSLDSDTTKYLHAKMDAAYWLVKSIEQRRMTLYRVMECIVRKQRAFFDRGRHYLAPLTLRDVAEEVEVHESTVSRATSNKYVQTPRGIFELKFFFTNGLESAGGGSLSSDSVKLKIKEMIAEEDAHKPLSDQTITEELTRQGVVISRRTVAKYREELGIASSAKRKRYV